MSIVAVDVTKPVANDVILGEFKAYINYGLPSALLIGPTRDGCKIKIERKIKEIAYDGAYGPSLDSDGVPLVRYEELIGRLILKNLCLKYFNKKIISDCESSDTWQSSDWGSTGGTYTAETTIKATGLQSAKCTADTLNYGIRNPFSATKDLTVLDNSEVSVDADFIGFAIYISTQDKVDLGSSNIQLSVHMDAVGTESNMYTYDVAPSSLNADQWTSFKIAKSSFTQVGTGDWSAVIGISFKLDTSPSAEVIFYVDAIDLIQNQSDSSIVPVNAGYFDMTNETSYKEYLINLDIALANYVENVTVVGQRADGKKIKIIARNVINDGKIEVALEDKDEAVTETQFTGHYKSGNGLTVPIELYEYV